MTTSPSIAERTVEELTASEVMTSPVVTVDAGDALPAVWHLMENGPFEHVVVVDRRRCLGIVAHHDLWVAWLLDLGDPTRRTVVHLVTATPCVAPGTPLSEVCQALMRSRNGAVLVLSDSGDVHGIVTTADVLRTLALTPC